jgi:hypothetical protein
MPVRLARPTVRALGRALLVQDKPRPFLDCLFGIFNFRDHIRRRSNHAVKWLTLMALRRRDGQARMQAAIGPRELAARHCMIGDRPPIGLSQRELSALDSAPNSRA